MANEKSRQEWLQDMKWRHGRFDPAVIADEMETMAGRITQWAGKCRGGDPGAWVVFGRLHHHFWDLAEALEDMFGTGVVSEGAELDG